jgi:excisionase family DNA binding protein
MGAAVDEEFRDEVLTAEEAAQLLKVTVQTVLKESRAGRLPGVKVGREWRYSRNALIRHLGRYVGEREEVTDDATGDDRPRRRNTATG